MSIDYEKYIKSQAYDGLDYDAHLSAQKSLEEIEGTIEIRYIKLLQDLVPSLEYSSIKILDIGPREFKSYHYFNKKYHNQITGIEVNKSALRLGEKEGTNLIELDAHFLDSYFAENIFDIIIAIHSLEHMYDMKQVIGHCEKILKPDGFLYFAIPIPCSATIDYSSTHYQDITSETVVDKICIDNGFISIFSRFHGEEVFMGYLLRGSEMIGLYQKKNGLLSNET